MTYKVAITIQSNSDEAERDLDRLAQKLREAGYTADDFVFSGGNAGDKIKKVGNSSRAAAADMANLTAQGNDVITMLAAGQNPMQLAIQQGTQISQVIGPKGAAGAFKALGGAVVGMLNPISLVTIGSLALAGTIVQMVRSSLPEVVSLEDAFDNLSNATSSYRDAVDAASVPHAELADRFGDDAEKVREYLLALADLEQFQLSISNNQVTDAIGADLESYFDLGSFQKTAEQFDLYWEALAPTSNGRQVKALVENVQAAYRAVGDAADLSVDEQIGAWQRLKEAATDAAAHSDGISQDEAQFIGSITQQIVNLHDLRRTQIDHEQAAEQRNNDAYRQYVQSRISSEQYLANQQAQAAADQADLHQRTYASYVATRTESERQVQAASQINNELTGQISLATAIAVYGADSREVTELRADAERAAFEEMLSTLGVAESVKDELRLAFITQQNIANTPMSGTISSAAQAAATLANNLGISLELAQQITSATGNVGGVSTDPTVSGFESNDPRSGQTRGVWTGGYSYTSDWRNQINNSGGSGGSGGGGGSRGSGRSEAAREAEREREAVESLIEQLQSELDISREMDPVQQELIRHRETLSAATDAEREQVEKLIRVRQHEADALERQTELQNDLRQAIYSTIDGTKSLTVAILEMIKEASLLGTGPLGHLFGGTSGAGGGGLIGQLGAAFLPGVFQQAAAPAAALGASPVSRVAAFAPPERSLNVSVDLTGANGDQAIQHAVTQGVSKGLREYDRDILPKSVDRISKDPRRIGG